MSAKKFLKPVSLVIASLLTGTLSNDKANAALTDAADRALKNAEAESKDGRPSPDPIRIERSADDKLHLQGHYSHSSHGSHRSHYSSYK